MIISKSQMMMSNLFNMKASFLEKQLRESLKDTGIAFLAKNSTVSNTNIQLTNKNNAYHHY
jgi:hypothetical protein